LALGGARPDHGAVRRRVAILVALLVTGLVLVVAPARADAAPAQQDPTTTPTAEGENPDAPEQDIIPRPNSGTQPEDAGDRGGALQLVVLGAIVAGVSVVVALAVRESRRNRRQGAAA
jgi:hypothetical protein